MTLHRRTTSLGDGPDDQEHPTPHVARNEDARYVCGKIPIVCEDQPTGLLYTKFFYDFGRVVVHESDCKTLFSPGSLTRIMPRLPPNSTAKLFFSNAG